MSTSTTNKKFKKLNINFDLHAEGDQDFKRKLILSMIDNLLELLQSYDLSIKQNSSDIFRRTAHKIAPTLDMLDDKDFILAIDDIRTQYYMDEVSKKVDLTFKNLCFEILRSLTEDAML